MPEIMVIGGNTVVMIALVWTRGCCAVVPDLFIELNEYQAKGFPLRISFGLLLWTQECCLIGTLLQWVALHFSAYLLERLLPTQLDSFQHNGKIPT